MSGTEMNEEQVRALKNWIVEASTLVWRLEQTLHEQHPEIKVEWQIRAKAMDGEKEWLGRMANTEELVRQASEELAR